MAPPSPHSGLLSGGGGADAPLPGPQLAPAALLCNPQVAQKLRCSGVMSPAWRAWSLPSLHRSIPSQRPWPPSSGLAPPWHPGFPSRAQPHLSRLPRGPSPPQRPPPPQVQDLYPTPCHGTSSWASTSPPASTHGGPLWVSGGYCRRGISDPSHAPCPGAASPIAPPPPCQPAPRSGPGSVPCSSPIGACGCPAHSPHHRGPGPLVY